MLVFAFEILRYVDSLRYVSLFVFFSSIIFQFLLYYIADVPVICTDVVLYSIAEVPIICTDVFSTEPCWNSETVSYNTHL
jgi:hypothetical protein